MFRPDIKYSPLIALWLLLIPATTFSQHHTTTEEYIAQYKDVAIKKMKEYHIPASITLAQGILESGSGNSKLARKANNHFGIKCHLDWHGKRFYMDDDKKHECFRKYSNPAESYRDHSFFLTQKGRYSFLFNYDITDYKSWAYGLKKAGYATNPKYPKLLIGLIERYNLSQYDTELPKRKKNKKDVSAREAYVPAPSLLNLKPVKVTKSGRKVFENNGIKFVLAKKTDTYGIIANEFDIFSWQLVKYNDVQKKHKLNENEPVYLEKKRKKAARKFKVHIVQQGESLWSVSQAYGIRKNKLMKMNDLLIDKNVPVGTSLKLR